MEACSKHFKIIKSTHCCAQEIWDELGDAIIINQFLGNSMYAIDKGWYIYIMI